MKHEIFHRQLDLRPASLDTVTRSFEAVATTGAGVDRRDDHGAYLERLDLSQIDPASTLGKTVLDSHQSRTHRDAIGVITSARLENDQLIVGVKIGRGKEGDNILEKIEDGVLRGVSIGYAIKKVTESRANGQRVKTIIPEIYEISIVPIPADPGATIRSQNMTEETAVLERPEDQQTRAQINAEIRTIASTAGLNRRWVDSQIDAEADIQTAGAAAFDEMRTRTTPPVRSYVTREHDNPTEYIERRAEALFARANPSHELSEPARQYANDSNVDIARDCLTRAGANITGLSAAELTTRALNTTSDFPIILGDAVGRSLRTAYSAAPSGLKQVARQANAKDFRAKNRIQLGEAPALQKVTETGEYKRGSLAEAKETFKLDTFGRIVGISRHAIVNDDLGAFASVSQRFGVAASSFEAKTLAELLEANPQMDDQKSLFHTDHANKAATASVLDEAGLSAARLSMRKQTGLSGELINVTPKFLIVPPELETTAEKILSQVQAAKTDDVNPFSRLVLVVEPRLTQPMGWYLVADTATIDGLEYAYLEGSPGPQIETRQGFDVDGLEIKIRLDFGAGFVDHRGWYKNEGA